MAWLIVIFVNLKSSWYGYQRIVMSHILLMICLLSFFATSCQQQINLAELIVDIDSQTGATPAYNPERVIPPHLHRSKEHKPIMVDPDIMNLALYMPVTASEEPQSGELEQLTDDIKTSGEFDFIEGPAWVQVDLEETVSVHAIAVWHYYANADIFDDVIVCASNDGNFSDNFLTLFNNDNDNSSGLGMGKDSAYIETVWGNIIDARGPDSRGMDARFIRVYTRRNTDGTLPRYLELAVYGFGNGE